MRIGGGDLNINFPFPQITTLEALFSEAQNLVLLFMWFGVTVAVLMIVVSGYTLITSSGNPDKIEQGQKGLTAAVIGLVVVFAAGLIIRFVLEIMGIS